MKPARILNTNMNEGFLSEFAFSESFEINRTTKKEFLQTKLLTKLSMIVALLLISATTFSQKELVRIGFIGNSITIGSSISNPEIYRFPSQTDTLLKQHGDTCDIRNFAVSGRTLLKHGDFPIWAEKSFKDCYQFAPNILFIMLGTNDTKPQNWDKYSKEFIPDYKAMIDTFRLRNPRIKFIVAYPPRAFAYGEAVWLIRDSIITKYVIPAVDTIVKYANAELIDFYNPLKDSSSLFPDNIHPSIRGHKVMAKIAFDKIISSDIINKVEKGYTYALSIKNNLNYELRQKDTAVISWTTINAKEAYLNGVKVDPNGSLAVAPLSTTKYTLVAKGELNEDSLVFEQKVYIPYLAKFYIGPSKKEFNVGETITLNLTYYDQQNKKITDSVFDVNWSITQGYGKFVNEGDNKIEFVADSSGKIRIEAKIDTVTCTPIRLTVLSNTAIKYSHTDNNILIFPNPVDDIAYFNISVSKPTQLALKVFDLSGRLCLQNTQFIETVGEHVIEFQTMNFLKGSYIVEIGDSENIYSGKLIKK